MLQCACYIENKLRVLYIYRIASLCAWMRSLYRLFKNIRMCLFHGLVYP